MATLLAFLMSVVLGQSAPATTQAVPRGHALVATAETDQVPESSGVIASRINPDLYWTHNDSGPYPPRIWAFRLNVTDRAQHKAKDMGYVQFENARNVDWEDIAIGPEQTIYVFDGGDNPPCDRNDKRIYRFTEPKFDVNGPPLRKYVRVDWLRWEYPDSNDKTRPTKKNDDRYDAECLFVHPKSSNIYIVTKRDTNKVPVARVFKLAGSTLTWNNTEPYVLTFVRDISAKVPGMVTAGDIDHQGEHVVIRNYLDAFEFAFTGGDTFDVVFQQKPTVISLLGEPQGEGICYTADEKEWVTTAEVLNFKGKHFPVYVTPIARNQSAPSPATGTAP